jgi:hypothetical protein
MEVEGGVFAVKRIGLVQEAQFLTHFFSPPKTLPRLIEHHEELLTNHKVHPLKYQHAHGPGVPLGLMGEGVAATAALDEKHVGILVCGGKLLVKRQASDGRLVFGSVGEIPAAGSLTREQGIALGVEGLLSTVPYTENVQEKVVRVSLVDCGKGVKLLVRAQCKLFESQEDEVIGVLSNHSKSFQRWFDLYLDMLFSGARRAIIVFHQKMHITRFEYYDFAVVESMCDAEKTRMRDTMGGLVAQIDKAVTENDVAYEVTRGEETDSVKITRI